MQRATWFPHGVGPSETYERQVFEERPAGGRFHPSQLEGLELSTRAHMVEIGGRREVVLILPGGRCVPEQKIRDAMVEKQLLLAIERATHGLYTLPDAAQA